MDLEKLKRSLLGRTPGLMDATGQYSVLVPLVEREGGLSLLYEVRAGSLRRQPGEVCFPGGRLEGAESPEECALRETWEELGIPREKIRILGRLDFIAHRANFILYPVLALVEEEAVDGLHLNPDEVAEVFQVPLEHLRNEPPLEYHYDLIPRPDENFPYELIGIPRDYRWQIGGEDVPIYPWKGHIIWGLTGRITRHLTALLGKPEYECGAVGSISPASAAGGFFLWGEDALRLAAFATVRRSWKVCDLGTGSGCLLLLLSGRATGLDLYGVELDPTAARAARDNLMENGLGGTVWTGDWNTLPGGTGPFDLVVSNPPYFAQGSGASGGPARMEGRDGLESLCRTAARLTRNGGRFALCHRPERLTDLLCALRVCGLEPKRLQLATHALDRPPSLVLVEAVRQGRPGLEVLPALYRAGPGGREEGA